MGGGPLGGVALVGAEGAADALGMPGPPRLGWIGRQSLEVSGDIAADVRVGARVAGLDVAGSAGVVGVVGGLLPGAEHHFFERVVRVQGGNNAPGRVVEQHRANAGRHAELEAVRGAEERLVPADRLALVVEDGPAAANPARADHGTAFRQRPGLGLDLLLDLAAEAVGVGEAELDFQAVRWQLGAGVGFARQRCRAGGLPLGGIARVCLLRALEPVQVVDESSGGLLAAGPARRRGGRPRRRCVALGWGQVSGKTVQRIAFRGESLAGEGWGFPITAVPATMPSVSKATAAWLRLGSLTRRGCSTR